MFDKPLIGLIISFEIGISSTEIFDDKITLKTSECLQCLIITSTDSALQNIVFFEKISV